MKQFYVHPVGSSNSGKVIYALNAKQAKMLYQVKVENLPLLYLQAKKSIPAGAMAFI